MAKLLAVVERSPGERCCLVEPEGALKEEAARDLGRDLDLVAHPVRLRLLSVLARNGEPVCVCDLESLVPVKQPTVSHHLRILRDSGLISSDRRGLWTYYFVQPEAVRGLMDRIAEGLGRLDPIEAKSRYTRR